MPVVTYTKAGAKAATPTKLDKSVFDVEVKNHQLLKDAYLRHLANSRDNLAVAKKRGEVSGGGRKPWRQKGTGRARVGSSRNPVWTGGGAAFGPTGEENYSRKLSLKARQQALRQALTLAVKENRLKVIESFNSSAGKVKPTLDLMKKLDAKGSVLIVLPQKDELVERATRNIASVRVVYAKNLNVYDVLNSDSLVVSKPSLEIISEWLGSKNE